MYHYQHKKRIEVQEVVLLLRDNGMEISTEKAALLLDFLYTLAILSIEQLTHKDYENGRPLH